MFETCFSTKPLEYILSHNLPFSVRKWLLDSLTICSPYFMALSVLIFTVNWNFNLLNWCIILLCYYRLCCCCLLSIIIIIIYLLLLLFAHLFVYLYVLDHLFIYFVVLTCIRHNLLVISPHKICYFLYWITLKFVK